jgi:hypothetical protein
MSYENLNMISIWAVLYSDLVVRTTSTYGAKGLIRLYEDL